MGTGTSRWQRALLHEHGRGINVRVVRMSADGQRVTCVVSEDIEGSRQGPGPYEAGEVVVRATAHVVAKHAREHRHRGGCEKCFGGVRRG